MPSDLPHRNCYWLVPGKVMAGEYPGGATRARSREKVRLHLDAGIRTFVDLTGEDELAPYDEDLAAEARRLGELPADHLRFPIRDMGVPSSPERMRAVLDAIDRAAAARPVVYVHCWGGIGRTGTVVGCYLVRHGLTGQEALRKLAALWAGVEKSDRYPESPQTLEQRLYVVSWDGAESP